MENCLADDKDENVKAVIINLLYDEKDEHTIPYIKSRSQKNIVIAIQQQKKLFKNIASPVKR